MEGEQGDAGNGFTTATVLNLSKPETPAPPPEGGGPVGSPAAAGKKRRGRPRKYGPDGKLNAAALSPKPISASAPAPTAVIDFSAEKRGKVRPASSLSKTKYEVENLGEWVPCSVGANFTPHIITVIPGEDVTMKVLSFSQQGPRAICILSANGVISSVTLRQPDSCGGTLTYEGRFEILSLSGSFMPSDSAGTKSRTGGMSVSLASPDGRVVGGGVAGLLVAASPVQVYSDPLPLTPCFKLLNQVCCLITFLFPLPNDFGKTQVVVGSFLSGNQHEQKSKKTKHDVVLPVSAFPVSSVEPKSFKTTTTTTTTATTATTSSFRAETWSPLVPDLRTQPTDINVSLSSG